MRVSAPVSRRVRHGQLNRLLWGTALGRQVCRPGARGVLRRRACRRLLWMSFPAFGTLSVCKMGIMIVATTGDCCGD